MKDQGRDGKDQLQTGWRQKLNELSMTFRFFLGGRHGHQYHNPAICAYLPLSFLPLLQNNRSGTIQYIADWQLNSIDSEMLINMLK